MVFGSEFEALPLSSRNESILGPPQMVDVRRGPTRQASSNSGGEMFGGAAAGRPATRAPGKTSHGQKHGRNRLGRERRSREPRRNGRCCWKWRSRNRGFSNDEPGLRGAASGGRRWPATRSVRRG